MEWVWLHGQASHKPVDDSFDDFALQLADEVDE
ncbi:hypothetical protein THIX_10028 [Thiomonas sp. X19]|nr:hypothetical protein THIX_10028 [Thiomonas sp. X19]